MTPGPADPNNRTRLSEWRTARSPLTIGTSDATLEFETENTPITKPASVAVRSQALPVRDPPGTLRRRSTLAIIGTFAAVGAAGLVWAALPPVDSTSTGLLHVESDPPGAEVHVDGTLRGLTPLFLTLPEGSHSMLVRRGPQTRRTTVQIDNDTGMDYHIIFWATPAADTVAGSRAAPDPAKRPAGVAAAASSAPPGWITANTPFPVQVLERGRLLGTSPGPVMLPPGTHDLAFMSEQFGFHETVQVRVSSGRGEAISLTIPRVAMNINALPWAEVFIDGTRVGDTPLANVMQPLGEHVILFRHPQLGERQQVARVTLGASPRVTVDMREK